MGRRAFRRVLLFATILLVAAGGGAAEVKPPGQYVGAPHPLMTVPRGRYRTSMGWVIASMIEFDNRGLFDSFNIFNLAKPEIYRDFVAAESAHIAGLRGQAYFRYAEGFARDLAQLQILTLENDRLSLALSSIPRAILVDLSAAAIGTGIKHVLPAKRAGIEALNSVYLEEATERTVLTRRDVLDLATRYDTLLGDGLAGRIAQGVSDGDLRDLVSESAISAGIAQAVAANSASPDKLLDLLRKQMVMDVAAHGCACVLDTRIHEAPAAIQAVFGDNGEYHTLLGYLLSIKLVPPDSTILNILSGPQATAMLNAELAKLRAMEGKNAARYSAYLRGLLVDLETLERAQIAALDRGVARSFLEGTVINVLFGFFAIGGGSMAQAVAILSNAGYGALDNYQTMSDELQIRIQMAALRETALDRLLPHVPTCGCGAGLAVAPTKVIKGAPPED
ncbi:hypothetical protein P1J78_22065 [Psychromarinibacter sp. C21-152]|uniref:Uncharacterized protein n=1 Tax=Psychromarinibacter sediminicola TaxID=3033385 RepID=A0AAE3NWQ7_9RHOB|nr:hypothetical protein [Psychromarinibacter sediminicola]MDF0603421.1 hypothetical protein [Psychromarinibacter sediminicola]